MFILCSIILMIGTLLDYISTNYALRHGAVEINPLAGTKIARILLSIGYAGVIETLAIVVNSNAHPVIAAWFLVIMGAVKVGVAISNYRVAKRQIKKGK